MYRFQTFSCNLYLLLTTPKHTTVDHVSVVVHYMIRQHPQSHARGTVPVGTEASKSVVKRRLLLDWGDEPSSAQAHRTIQNTGVIDMARLRAPQEKVETVMRMGVVIEGEGVFQKSRQVNDRSAMGYLGKKTTQDGGEVREVKVGSRKSGQEGVVDRK